MLLLFLPLLLSLRSFFVDAEPLATPLQACYNFGKVCHSWTYDNDTIYVTITTATTGWSAIMLNASDGAMTNGDCWIVWVNDTTGEVVASDRFSTTFAEPSANETQDLTGVSGFQNATHTVVVFQRKFVTGDPFDYPITNQTIPFGWAFGMTDQVSYHHENASGYLETNWLSPLPPGPMGAPILISSLNDSLILGWMAPSDSGNAEIESYDLEMSLSGANNFRPVYQGLDFQTTVIDLTPNTTYDFRVSAENAGGFSPVSPILTVSTLATAPFYPPDNPQPPTLLLSLQYQLNVAWKSPDLHGETLTYFQLESCLSGTSAFTTIYSGKGTEYNATGLDPNTLYDFRLLVTSSGGTSNYSLVATFKTQVDLIPCQVDNDCNDARRLCINNFCQCGLGWLTPACSVESFFTQCSSGVCRWWSYDDTTLYVQLSAPTEGWVGVIYAADDGAMTNGDCWIVDVDDSTGIVAATDMFSETYAPPDPNEKQDLIAFSGWENATHTVVSFQRLFKTGDPRDKDIVPGDQLLSWAYGSSDVVSYHGGNRNEVPTINWLASTYPDAPNPPVATAATNVSLTLNWTAPAYTGTGPITSYTLQMDQGGGNFQSIFTGLATSHQVTGLSPTTSYTFRLGASNSRFASDFSQSTSITTLDNNYRPPPQPQPPQLSQAYSTALWLKWQTPDTYGYAVISYVVKMLQNTTWVPVYTGTANEVNITGLEILTSYSFTFSVQSLAGVSPESAAATFTTLHGAVCPNDCLNRGNCSIAGQCECQQGFLGPDCSISAFEICEDNNLWCVFYRTDDTYIYVRLEAPSPPVGWIGMMLGAQDGMTGGDAWVVSYDPSTGTVVAEDRYSTGFVTPTLDPQQDLEEVTGYANNSHSVISFRRLLNTGDPHDYVLVPGDSLTYTSYAFGRQLAFEPHDLSDCGQFLVDYFSGTIQYLPDVGYGHFAPVVFAFIGCVLGGMFFHYFSRTRLGGWLLYAKVGTLPKRTWIDVLTFDIWINFVDLTIGELLVVLCYIGSGVGFYVLGYSAINDAGKDPQLIYAQLAMVNLCIILFPITRNSLWVFIFGIPFERAVKFHRWVARVAIAFMITHGALEIKKNDWNILWSQVDTVHGDGAMWGALAVLCFLIMFLTSIEPIRRNMFEVFYSTHFIFAAGIVFVWLHNDYFKNWVIAPLVLYGVDRVIRAYRSRKTFILTSARVLANGDGQVTELRLRHKNNFSFRPGDYCFINIPELSLTEWHPFSLSSPPGTRKKTPVVTRNTIQDPLSPTSPTSPPPQSPTMDGSVLSRLDNLFEDEITFHILDMGPGTWTGRLAEKISSTKMEYEKPFKKILVDGPYGKVGMPVHKYPVIVLVAGGVGVTPLMSILTYLRNQYKVDQLPHVRAVHFIWASRHHHAFTEWFPDVLHAINSQPYGKFYLHLYWTDRASRAPNQTTVPVSAKSIKNPKAPVLYQSQSLGEVNSGSAPSPSSFMSDPSMQTPLLGSQSEKKRQTSSSLAHRLSQGFNRPKPEEHDEEDPQEDDEFKIGDLPIERAHRPDYPTLFDAFSRDSEDPSEVAVLACGPMPMIESAQKAALERGFHFHKETFFL